MYETISSLEYWVGVSIGVSIITLVMFLSKR